MLKKWRFYLGSSIDFDVDVGKGELTSSLAAAGVLCVVDMVTFSILNRSIFYYGIYIFDNMSIVQLELVISHKKNSV